MKRLFGLAFAAIALVGCQNVEAPIAESEVAQQAAKADPRVGKPLNEDPTEIGLVVRPGRPITVGFPADEAFRAFKDPKNSGFESDDLPPKFDFPYHARTWEPAQYQFGEITYYTDLVAAMYTEEKVSQERVDELVKAHTDQIPDITPAEVKGNHVHYWFWDKSNQRLMICAYQTEKEGIRITIAMGDDVVLDALNISLVHAEKDKNQVDSPLLRPSG